MTVTRATAPNPLRLRITNHRYYGAHMSIRGGVSMAIERARSIRCTAMQMFVKNNMQWFARPLTPEEIRAFLNHVQRGELLSVFGARQLPDQPRRDQSAISRQFHSSARRRTGPGRST